jgi:hypothetical protein
MLNYSPDHVKDLFNSRSKIRSSPLQYTMDTLMCFLVRLYIHRRVNEVNEDKFYVFVFVENTARFFYYDFFEKRTTQFTSINFILPW